MTNEPCCDQMFGDLFIDGRYVEATCPVHGKQPNYRTATMTRAAEPSPVSDEMERVSLGRACRDIAPYLEWTVGPESPGCHPTMPSAVGAFLDATAEVRALADPRAALRSMPAVRTPMVDEVERVAGVLEPKLFCGDPVEEHRAASPLQVDFVKERVRAKAREVLAALSPDQRDRAKGVEVERLALAATISVQSSDDVYGTVHEVRLAFSDRSDADAMADILTGQRDRANGGEA